MRHPFEHTAGKRSVVFVPLLLLTLTTAFFLNYWGRPLKTEAAPAGIVSLELAGDPVAAQRIVNSWNPSARMAACVNLGLDFLFLVAYSTTLAFACVWASQRVRIRRLRVFGLGLAWAQWVAALFDVGENTALLFALFLSPVTPWPEIAQWCAIPKFILIALGVIYSTFGIVISRWHRALQAPQLAA